MWQRLNRIRFVIEMINFNKTQIQQDGPNWWVCLITIWASGAAYENIHCHFYHIKHFVVQPRLIPTQIRNFTLTPSTNSTQQLYKIQNDQSWSKCHNVHDEMSKLYSLKIAVFVVTVVLKNLNLVIVRSNSYFCGVERLIWMFAYVDV